jgi:predicted transcriptional regulator
MLFVDKGGDLMPTATVRIPEDKRDTLKIIASIEKRDIMGILSELIDEYIDRHQETLELLSRPEWVSMIRKGKEEISQGIKGKSLNELED